MAKDYYTTVTHPDGYVTMCVPPMHYTLHAEGDMTFASRGRNLGERNLPRKIKKWARKESLFQPTRWRPWWTGRNRKAVVPVTPGILRTRKRKH